MSGVPISRTYNAVVPPSNYVAGVGRGAMGFTTVRGMDGWMDGRGCHIVMFALWGCVIVPGKGYHYRYALCSICTWQ